MPIDDYDIEVEDLIEADSRKEDLMPFFEKVRRSWERALDRYIDAEQPTDE